MSSSFFHLLFFPPSNITLDTCPSVIRSAIQVRLKSNLSTFDLSIIISSKLFSFPQIYWLRELESFFFFFDYLWYNHKRSSFTHLPSFLSVRLRCLESAVNLYRHDSAARKSGGISREYSTWYNLVQRSMNRLHWHRRMNDYRSQSTISVNHCFCKLIQSSQRFFTLKHFSVCLKTHYRFVLLINFTISKLWYKQIIKPREHPSTWFYLVLADKILNNHFPTNRMWGYKTLTGVYEII